MLQNIKGNAQRLQVNVGYVGYYIGRFKYFFIRKQTSTALFVKRYNPQEQPLMPESLEIPLLFCRK